MRRRFQKGSLQKVRGAWVARWRQDGERKARILGRVSQMTKAQAQSELAALVAPLNSKRSEPSERTSFGDFVRDVYLPFYRRKWKRSTARTNEDRLSYHLTSEFDARLLGSFDRDGLQVLLDRRAETLSFSVVDHLRWDLRQIFDMAVAEGYLHRSPATLLFTPRECRRAATRVMTPEDVRQMLSVLDVRERLIAKLALLAGMRPGEVFGLRWVRIETDYADIRQRVYRGDLDSPKSARSVRFAALSDGLLTSIDEWRAVSVDASPDAWVFPSEKLTTPLAKDNCWRRSFLPRLMPVGLAWANFQVMRRTHSSLLKELGVDPHVRAEQMGHTVDVNENVYTVTSLSRRKEAVNALERAIGA
ncbi:MAG TPA: tyrosine-type recombinase/integrase [Terriglobales bacterium]